MSTIFSGQYNLPIEVIKRLDKALGCTHFPVRTYVSWDVFSRTKEASIRLYAERVDDVPCDDGTVQFQDLDIYYDTTTFSDPTLNGVIFDLARAQVKYILAGIEKGVI